MVNGQSGLTDMDCLHIKCIRNYNLETFFDFKLKECSVTFLGRKAEIVYSSFDNYLKDRDQNDLINGKEDYILIALRLEMFYLNNWDLLLESKEVSGAMIGQANLLMRDLLHDIRLSSDKTVIFLSFEAPVFSGNFPPNRITQWKNVVDLVNQYVQEQLKEIGNSHYLNMDERKSEVGSLNYYDERRWYLFKSPYSKETVHCLCMALVSLIRPFLGMTVKCLVLDCDNVLWGGIIGEDGINHVKLSHEITEGANFRDLQIAFLEAYKCGILLAICSKNNNEDVHEMLRSHPAMILKEHHFSAIKINWEPKTKNIEDIAKELNIGLHNLLFLDDLEYEIELVKKTLPAVQVLKVDPQNISLTTRILRSIRLWDSTELTHEDLMRGKMYREQNERKRISSAFADPYSFNGYLNTEVQIRAAQPPDFPRITQLMMKCSQFNLTNRKFLYGDLETMFENPDMCILTMKVADKFGDMGIVGSAILKKEESGVKIVVFLLSCRTIGRKLEEVLAYACLRWADLKGAELLIGEYIPTGRNRLVEDFYYSMGFAAENNGDKGEWLYFIKDRSIRKKLNHLALTERTDPFELTGHPVDSPVNLKMM